MNENNAQNKMITDYATGMEIPLIGAEENRQKVERFLVEEKGYAKKDIEINAPITFAVKGETYRSQVDLVLSVRGKRFMVIKCAAGSLGSRERETLAAARLLDIYQIPYAVVSDGETAIIMDTVNAAIIGKGLHAIFSKTKAQEISDRLEPCVFPESRLEKERLIFRSYDGMNVNVARNV